MSERLHPKVARALCVAGHNVEPTGDRFGLWRVNDKVLTDGDAIALTIRFGLTP